jgi:branched-chain amino acid transport system ATP-binding protein
VTPLLELEDVHAHYGETRALHGVSLSVDEGSSLALLGANGAGKTTTLRAVSGLVRKTGHVSFAGRSIARKSPEAVARLGVAHVPQGRGIIGDLTVEENLRLGAYTRRDRAAVRADTAGVLEQFPRLGERLSQAAGTLSGGEQQMLALGRALLQRPRLLMLDEPSLGLAPLIVREIFDVLERLNREEGLAVLVVEQDAAVALRACREACVLEVGRVVLSGPSEELAENESVRKAYLGY